MLKTKLLASAAVIALIFGASQSAHATPYAFASTTYDNFQIELGGTATLDGGSVNAATSQNYPGSTNTGNSVTNSFPVSDSGIGATAKNAFGGPDATYSSGTPAAVTSSTPSPITESSLKGGDGSQAASSVGAISPFVSSISTTGGDGSIGAAETGGLYPNGSIAANSSQSEVFYTITTGAGGGTVQFSADVQVFVEALTTQLGETASAYTNNSITLSCYTGACSGATANTYSPQQLNISVTVGPKIDDLTLGSQTAFNNFTQSFSLLASSTYRFSLSSQLSTQTNSVPEPASLLLLGTALLGFGAMARRRRRAC